MEDTQGLREIEVFSSTVGAEEFESALTPEGEPKELKLPKLPQRGKFHGYPTAWDRSMAAYYSGMEMKEIMEQAEFHRVALKEVRKALGVKCAHLIHVTDSTGIITFKAKLKLNGGTKIVNVDSEVLAKDLVAESYRNLNNVLLDELRS